ncbi:MAG: DUF5615 family PIN-like protein [Bifidobacteriaceae bacterium]|nr:DUF5615 family PIN-like protein [Bifidobacteriaceae bacterium]
MTARLLLDEHFAPAIAKALLARGFDVVALLDDPDRAGLADPEVYTLAGREGRRVVTENIRDFRPLLAAAIDQGGPVTTLLLVPSGAFPRSRTNPGPLIKALAAWLDDAQASARLDEEWL